MRVSAHLIRDAYLLPLRTQVLVLDFTAP